MSNIFLNELTAPKHVLDSIPLTPCPDDGRTGHLATFGYDDAGEPVVWNISEDRDDRRSDPDSPMLVGLSHNLPDLEPVKALSHKHPKEEILVEFHDLSGWSYSEVVPFGRVAFKGGEMLVLGADMRERTFTPIEGGVLATFK